MEGSRSEEADAGRDLISELPAEVKDRILECLPTRDAARTALISTQWNDAWLQHGRLEFGVDFFLKIPKGEGDSGIPYYVKIITYILLQRLRPVKKFSLSTFYFGARSDPKPEQSDFDQWFLFLSRNGVEELCISLSGQQYKLPFCIVSCPTIKQLSLSSLYFDFPINAPCIFPRVTSLEFNCVAFNRNVNGIVYSIPNLEKLGLASCEGVDNFKISAPKLEKLDLRCEREGISNFKISAPKLESFSIIGLGEVESRWFALQLKAIKVLCFSAPLLLYWEDVEVASFPTAIHLQVIKIDALEFANEKQFKGVLQLLQKSPNLCELDIIAIRSNDEMEDDDIVEAISRLLNDPESCIINQDLKMLKTIKIEQFCGSTIEMLFVKMLLSKSPILERVVITESYDIKDDNTLIKILKELMCCPRASPKAHIVIKGIKTMLKDWLV